MELQEMEKKSEKKKEKEKKKKRGREEERVSESERERMGFLHGSIEMQTQKGQRKSWYNTEVMGFILLGISREQTFIAFFLFCRD